MTAKTPPIPSDNRSPKGTGEAKHADETKRATGHPTPDPDKQGQQGNSKINTTHQGYQQDR